MGRLKPVAVVVDVEMLVVVDQVDLVLSSLEFPILIDTL